MNNIFNIRRFGLVFRKDFMENGKRYALLFLTMLGIMAIVSIFMSLNYYELYLNRSDIYDLNEHNKQLLISLSFAFIAGGLLFSSTFMAPMNSKLKRLSYLSNPSSNLEKFLTRWIIVTIGYIIAFFVAMWIADVLRVAVISAKYPDLEIKFLDLSKLYDTEGSRFYMIPKVVFTIFLFIIFLFQSLFILGATFFEKMSFLKTFVTISILTYVFIMFWRFSIFIFYEDGLDGLGNVLGSFFENKTNEENEQLLKLVAYSALSVFTLASWVLAFFRFRESEINKRL